MLVVLCKLVRNISHLPSFCSLVGTIIQYRYSYDFPDFPDGQIAEDINNIRTYQEQYGSLHLESYN